MAKRSGPVLGTDALDVIEVQSAILVRNFELLRRRTEHGLDRAGYLLLRALQTLGPSDINTLAAALGLDPSTAGRQVAAMQADGLVERTPAPEDRRRTIVEVSGEGRRQMNAASRARRERTADLLTEWDAADLHTLADMFTRYNAAVADRYLTGGKRVGAQPNHG